MSMQSLAQAIQSQGRGNDTMLVHMTPNEVGGLQNLANNFYLPSQVLPLLLGQEEH